MVSWTIFVATLCAAVSVASAGLEHLPGKYRLETDMRNEDIHKVLKEMEFSDREAEMIRNWKSVRAEVSALDGGKYQFKMTAAGKPVFDRTYEDSKDYDDQLPDGRKYKAHVTLKDNTVTRKDTHANFLFNVVGVFSKAGCEATLSVDKKGKVTSGKLKFVREGDNAAANAKDGATGALKQI